MKLLLSINAFKNISYTGDETFYSYIKSENANRVKGFKPSFLYQYAKEIQLIITSDNTHRINIIDEDDNVHSYYNLDSFLNYMTGEHLEITYDTIDNNSAETLATLISSKTYMIYDDTLIYLYTLNCERNRVNKREGIDYILRASVTGKFRNIVSVRNPIIDIEGVFDLIGTSNYVYIVGLERYYFIESIDLVSKNITRLSLIEDVLTSHSDLIKQQQAFVSRSAEFGDYTIIDNRYPLESVKTVEYITPTDTEQSTNLKNIDLDVDFDISATPTDRVFMVSIAGGIKVSGVDNVDSPTGSDLPTIACSVSPTTELFFVAYNDLKLYMRALSLQSNLASYLNSIVILPFIPTTAYDISNYNYKFYVGEDYVLYTDGQFHHDGETISGATPVRVGATSFVTSPYLIVKDINIPNCTKWYEKEPYTVYEIYIPFVGWIKLDTEQVNNSRLLIYYTIDYTTGNGTAFIYNMTTEKMIYTTSCQIGIKISALITNAQELARERQSIELNTLIGLLASGVSVIAGVASENPVAIAGGVLSAGKTIASAVNRERMMFERAQVTYGSGESAFHSPLEVVLRKTYYKPIITDTASEDIYKEINGLPCNKYMSLANCHDMYLEIGEIHFNTKQKDIYNDEVNEIVKLLQEGVIL